MLESLNRMILSLAGLVLDPLLGLPRDLVLVVVSVGTAFLLTLIRRLATDQDFLKRCSQDRKRLRERLKAVRLLVVQEQHQTRPSSASGGPHRSRKRPACGTTSGTLVATNRPRPPHRPGKESESLTDAEDRRRRDTERLKKTINMINIRALRQEGLPLLLSLLPIVFIATWAFARLGYLPPREGAIVPVTMYLPASQEGKLIHLVPADGMSVDGGWMTEVRVDTVEGKEVGRAVWRVQAAARAQPYPLCVRLGPRAFEHLLLVGQRTYSEPTKLFGGTGEFTMHVGIQEYRPFHLIPGLPQLFFPPWLIAYLIIVIPFVPLLKRVLGVH